ncbi:NUDIX hydrolase, partial [Gordonia sp. NPDC003585]
MSPTTTLILLVAIVAIVLLVGWAVQTANRLDRLNVRVDLARQALHASLDRRSVVARAIATDMAASGTPEVVTSARDLAAVADHAERADPATR